MNATAYQSASARDWVDRALLLDPDNLVVRSCSLALELDDKEGGLDALKPFFERITSTMLMRHLQVDPDLDPVRDDPRFMLAASSGWA